MQSRFQHITSSREATNNITDMLEIIPLVIEESNPIHDMNVADMNTFQKYSDGNDSLVFKFALRNTKVDFKVTFNFAEIAKVYFTSYTTTNPPKYTLRKGRQEVEGEQLKAYVDCLDDDSHPAKIKALILDAAINRVSYQYSFTPSKIEQNKGRFFGTCKLNPKDTYLVYSKSLPVKSMYAINSYSKEIYDNNNKSITITVYNVWTNWHRFEFVYDSGKWSNSLIPANNELIYYYLSQGWDISQIEKGFRAVPLNMTTNGAEETELPVVEYLFRPDGKNCFEVALPQMDALNTALSLNADIANMKLDYILKFFGISLGTWEDVLDENGNVIGQRNITLENVDRNLFNGKIQIDPNQTGNVQPDVSVVEFPTSHADAQINIDNLMKQIELQLSLPLTGTNVGGNATGAGANVITGGKSAFNMAGLIVGSLIDAEGRSLDVNLSIGKQLANCPFKDLLPTNVDIKAMLNKDENLMVQAQAFQMLISSSVNRVMAYVISGLVPDASETAKMDELEKDANFTRLLNQKTVEILELAKANKDANPIEQTTTEIITDNSSIIDDTNKGIAPISNAIVQLAK